MVIKMRNYFILLLLTGLLFSCNNNSKIKKDNRCRDNNFGYTLMPMPDSITEGEGVCRIDHSFRVSINAPENSRVEEALQRFITRLDKRTALFLSHSISQERGELHILFNRKGDLIAGEDESYHLRISPDNIEMSAITDLGILHGLETLLQLISSDDDGFYIPCMVIDDEPRFTWRGLMLDVSRHFIPEEVIKRNIDAMAAVKMNVLHLHLSDDQGFRIETQSCPNLYKSGSDGLYFTKDQMRGIIKYADSRGVRIVPEFDMPGHTTSWFPGYPDLAVFPGKYNIEREYGIFDCVMDPTKESTYIFLDKFISEMCDLFPDKCFHIGGDENNGVQWDSSQVVMEFKQAHGIKSNHDLQAYFNKRINNILLKNNKKMMGWEEIANKTLDGDIVVQSWKGDESLVEAVKAGNDVVLSKGYYIDLLFPASDHYLVDPMPSDSTLTEKEKSHILGGEATMWSEYVTIENIDSRIWPRTAAIAERLWSSADLRDVSDMYRRLKVVSLQLENLGLTHISNQKMMMRRLMNSDDINALQVLVNTLEPLHEYQRWGNFKSEHGYTLNQFSPFTRIMDVAGPDAPDALFFNQNVTRFLSEEDHIALELIKPQLEIWINNKDRLASAIEKSPVLNEIAPLSENLAIVAGIAEKALKYIEKGKNPDSNWLDQSKEQIKKASQPHGQTTLMITNAVGKLIAAAEDGHKE